MFQFVGVEGFVTAIVDMFPNQLRRDKRREIFIALVCFVSFLIGLTMVTNGGMYVFQLFDYYSGSINRFYDNIKMMIGYEIIPYMKISWAVTTPLFSIVMFVLCVYSYSELTYNRTYKYPRWAILFGWAMACSSVIMIPLTAIVKLAMEEGTLRQDLIDFSQPFYLPEVTIDSNRTTLLVGSDQQNGCPEPATTVNVYS
ncbi:hypothetical protein NP493_1231g00013 [Ridgeia piscesae]|uniref:Uncharacterized protein n=1 Tax=Ridgeia piscesae TaxID=27915 RepID=A0AAD9KB60_RIDPI|nr:hypothetical protein NP493_1231g00013 [Ridgeia piscesae]